MAAASKLKLFFTGILGSFILSLFAIVLDVAIVRYTGRTMFGFNALIFVFDPLYYGFWGLLLTVPLLFVRKGWAAAGIALIVSILCAWGSLSGIFAQYRVAAYTGSVFFWRDVVTVALAFIGYPLIALAIWKMNKSTH
jgi:hypothetical protein